MRFLGKKTDNVGSTELTRTTNYTYIQITLAAFAFQHNIENERDIAILREYYAEHQPELLAKFDERVAERDARTDAFFDEAMSDEEDN